MPSIFDYIANPTQGRLGQIGQQLIQNQQLKIQKESNDIKNQIMKSQLDEQELKNYINENKAVYGLSTAIMAAGMDNPEILNDPVKYNEYMTSLTTDMPEDVVNNFKGIMPWQLPDIQTKSGLLVSAFEDKLKGVQSSGLIIDKNTREVVGSGTRSKSGQVSVDTGKGSRPLKENEMYYNKELSAEVLQGTKAQQFKNKMESNEARANIRTMSASVDDMIKVVNSEDFVGGATGSGLSLLNSGVQQIRQMLGAAPMISDGKLNMAMVDPEITKEGLGRLRKMAMSNDKFEALKAEFAFLKARQLDPNGRISDKDVLAAERMFAAGADKRSIINLLNDMRLRAVRNYNIMTEEKGDPWRSITMEELGYNPEAYAPAQKPSGMSVDQQADELYKSATGQ